MVVVAALGVGGYFYLRIDDETRRLAESALDRACGELRCRVGAARFASDRSVTLRDVEIVDPGAGGPPERVVSVEELRLVGRFDVATLMRDQPQVERVVLRRVTASLVRGADGSWNLGRLRLPQQEGRRPPAVEIVDGSLRVVDRTGAFAPQTITGVAASIEPRDDGGFDLKASFEGGVAERLELAGSIHLGTGALQLGAEVVNATPGDEILRLVGNAFAPGKTLPTIRGAVSGSGRVERRDASSPISWTADFRCENAQVWDPRLRQPLTDVTLVGSASDRHLLLQRATARWGAASLAVVGRRSGWTSRSPMAVRARLDGADVGSVPIELLPAKLLRLRERFLPAGTVTIEAEADFDGRDWDPRATIRVADAAFEDTEKFRYRLTKASGRIDINGGLEEGAIAPAPRGENQWAASVDLTGLVEGTPVRITAAFPEMRKSRPANAQDTGGMPVGWVEISGVGVPVTQRVIEALGDESTKRILRSLRPSGRVDLRWRGEKTGGDDPRFHPALDLRLAGCRIDYVHFPYPLDRVTGWVRQRDQDWRFHDLVSRDPSGAPAVTGSGDLLPAPDGSVLTMRLGGAATPLNETLYAALPSYAQEAWQFLRPRGKLDFDAVVTHRITRRAPGAPDAPPESPDVRLTMRPHNREMAVEPTFTPGGRPYRLDRVDGRFDWEAGRLTMRGARAEHGRTAIETDGVWETASGGGWRLNLSRLHADRVTPDHDLLLSSPAGLRGVLETLRPMGGFDLFNSSIEVATDGVSPPTARWDVGIDCHQATLQAGVPLDGVSGVVRLGGYTDGVKAETTGELELDSLFWNDLQLTNVRGPLWADGVDCWFGEGACRKTGSAKRRVTAEAYGGRLAMNGHARYGGRPRYGLQTKIEAVDVGRLAAEWMQRPEAIAGRLDGQLEVQGAGVSAYGMQGRGALAVSDANLYQLPVMVRLLKVLRNRAPDGTAFDKIEAEFDLQGEQIAFSRLDLKGDAISLYGDGRATLDRELDLTFGSVVGRTDFVVPMFRSFVGQASEQLLRIRVLGTTDAPEIRREALPMVSGVLEQLQADRPAPAPPGRGAEVQGIRSTY